MSLFTLLINYFFKYFEIFRLVFYLTLLYIISNFYILSFIFILYIIFKINNKYRINNKNKNKNAIIIGSGVSGIGSAYYLSQNNIPYIILESSSSIGGTWRDNKFPGCRLDTENVEYCYSFDIILDKNNTNWSRQQVIDYLLYIVKKYNIMEKIIFNQKVERVNFNNIENIWYVYTNNGIYTSNFLYNCNGSSNTNPHIPKYKNTQDFQGEIIHSTKLDENKNFTDKDVVVVGSGATMVSMITSLKNCKNLTVIQRSPTYIYESDCKPDILWNFIIFLDKYMSTIVNIKYIYQIYRMIDGDILFFLIRKFQNISKFFFKNQWTDVIDSKFINENFNPKYDVLEQRIAISNGLKNLLKDKKVNFKTSEISYFEKNQIVLKSGEKVKCDICILATGFDLNFFRFPIEIDNKEIELRNLNWYKGLIMGGIPNYFHPVGCFDCSWTQRIESLSKLSVNIINYIDNNNIKKFIIPKKKVPHSLTFKPNYILRHIDTIPIVYGITQIPSYDYFFSFGLKDCEEILYL